MTTEEKAKAYDEALKRAKELLSIGLDDTRDKKVVLSFFPELKESEDERIRKALIGHLTRVDNEIPLGAYHRIDGVEISDILAWLEDQGAHYNFRKKIQVGDQVTRNRDGVLVNLSQLKRVAKPADVIESGKQGGLKSMQMISAEESLGIDSDTYNKIVDECIYGEQKQEWSEEDDEDNVQHEQISSLNKEIEQLKEDYDKVVNEKFDILGKYNNLYNRFDEQNLQIKELQRKLKERYCPQSHWKPSEEQIRVVSRLRPYLISDVGGNDIVIFDSLLEKLKEL